MAGGALLPCIKIVSTADAFSKCVSDAFSKCVSTCAAQESAFVITLPAFRPSLSSQPSGLRPCLLHIWSGCSTLY